MRGGTPDHAALWDSYPDLRELLARDAGAYDYFFSLPSRTRDALRRQESITSCAELQSFAADEGETPFG